LTGWGARSDWTCVACESTVSTVLLEVRCVRTLSMLNAYVCSACSFSCLSVHFRRCSWLLCTCCSSDLHTSVGSKPRDVVPCWEGMKLEIQVMLLMASAFTKRENHSLASSPRSNWCGLTHDQRQEFRQKIPQWAQVCCLLAVFFRLSRSPQL